jgi:transcriptional regulator with XRE-family HTH domain
MALKFEPRKEAVVELGDQVEALLKALNIRAAEFATAIGASPATITRITSGKKIGDTWRRINPTAPLIAEICLVYNVNANWLLLGRGDMFMTEHSEPSAEEKRARQLAEVRNAELIQTQSKLIRQLEAENDRLRKSSSQKKTRS